MNEVTYKKMSSGSFALYYSGMLNIFRLSGILNRIPREVLTYFETLYNAKLIQTNGDSYLFFKKEKQAKELLNTLTGLF
jgi:hypothetical protein